MKIIFNIKTLFKIVAVFIIAAAVNLALGVSFDFLFAFGLGYLCMILGTVMLAEEATDEHN